jgi:hypothetical protein
MLWIHEWDHVGGSSAVWSTVYAASRHRLGAAVAEGFEAVDLVRAMHDTLRRVATASRDELLAPMRHSLAYEESLFETLAWYRRAMLAHYRWLDTGDGRARAEWRYSAPRFAALAGDHAARFRGDVDAPAYDFAAARAAVDSARWAPALAWAARVLLVAIGVLLVRPRWARAPVVAALATAAVAVLTAVASPRLLISAALVAGVAAAVTRQAWLGLSPPERSRAARVLRLGLLAMLGFLVAAAAVRGSGYFWFLVWSSTALRMSLVTAVVALAMSTLYGVGVVSRRALGGMLIALGVAAVTSSVLAPELPVILAALERPLAVAPMGASFIHGVMAYFEFPRAAPWYPAMGGTVLMAIGQALRLR